jgi:hypothetical protein
MLDIKRVLTEHKIYWTDQGHNVAKGNINIKCPLCGPQDKSEHLGIRLTDGWWSCWRDGAHSGKNINRLLAILEIYIIDDRNDVMQRLINRSFFGMQEVQSQAIIVESKKITRIPTEFIPIEEETIFTKPYTQYLARRGFSNPLLVCKDYGLCWSVAVGKWQRRLLIPTWLGEEVTWTGRAIYDTPMRYLSPAVGEARNIKECLWNYNDLLKTEGDAIIICEGPLDAIYLDSLFKAQAIRATALFGLSIPDFQISLLKKVCLNFKKVLIGLDQGTLSQSLRLTRELEMFNPVIMRLPKKDFNEMSPVENQELMEKYLNENNHSC